MKKRLVSTMVLITVVFWSVPNMMFYSFADDITPFEVDAKSAILMDSESGEVLYSKNADEALPPASVTKVMTLLLVMEAIDTGMLKLNDVVSVSENAASMGGSQVYLKPGEEMTVDEMLKCVVVSSANDAAVALAERVAGSEGGFIQLMNERAASLGMKNTNFENVTGLDDKTVNHTISAGDIAIASRELITKHPLIFNYSTIWMDTIRNGQFGLTNTNRLIRFYNGATGLKTGSTSKAGFCISATAERDGMHLIAVIMGAETRDTRNEAAKTLLDWGFATYSSYRSEGGRLEPVRVTGGMKDFAEIEYGSFSKLLHKAETAKVTKEIVVGESVVAPVKKGDVLGKVVYKIDGEEIGEVSVLATETVERIDYLEILKRLIKNYCLS